LKFEILKIEQETFKQVTHDSISINLPQCINNLHVLYAYGFLFCFSRLKGLIFALRDVKGFLFLLLEVEGSYFCS